MTTEEKIQYIEFMVDPENIRNCKECPENCDCDDWQGRLPCGQYHCWVELHSEYNNKE